MSILCDMMILNVLLSIALLLTRQMKQVYQNQQMTVLVGL
jgi:hypothetical protein